MRRFCAGAEVGKAIEHSLRIFQNMMKSEGESI
jgi:hypothetical protein